MSQLPRLLHPNSSRAIPIVEIRTKSTPAFDLRRYASESIMHIINKRELAVLRPLRKKEVPSMKIVFSDEPMQRERSVIALAMVVKRPLNHDECGSKLLWPHVSARKQLLKTQKCKAKLTTRPLTGRGMALPKGEQQFLAQPRRTLLNLLRGEVRIALVDKRNLNENRISFDAGFLSKYGFTGRMHVDRLPFDIPTNFCLLSGHMALMDKF